MAESTLALTFLDFQGHVGDYLGYGWGDDNGDVAWSAEQERNINKCVESGQRRVYFPPLLPGEPMAHSWSFLHPQSTLTLTSGATELALPDDFGGVVEGEIVASSSGLTAWRPLFTTNWAQVRRRLADHPDTTGMPEWVAVEPIKGTGASAGQRFQLVFYPEADRAVTVRLTYSILPDKITGALPYHYGGAQHSETFLASCIASAELFRDDLRGPREAYFQDCLRASVMIDRRARPQYLGYNSDRSDSYDQGRVRRWWDGPVVTVNGVEPT